MFEDLEWYDGKDYYFVRIPETRNESPRREPSESEHLQLPLSWCLFSCGVFLCRVPSPSPVVSSPGRVRAWQRVWLVEMDPYSEAHLISILSPWL